MDHIRPTRSTKRVLPRSAKPPEQPTADNAFTDPEHLPSALLPVALTPSRAPSNTLVASSRKVFFEEPIHLDFASGWAKGPVMECFGGSYYHECIIVLTRGGHTYRVDRRPDPNAPFDTIMKGGCKPYDTVQMVGTRSWMEIEKASNCVVEVHWQDNPPIDLLFVLSICFALRQDKYAQQYSLQRYNCYFLSWTIIMVAVRVMAAWETRVYHVMSNPLQIQQKASSSVVPTIASQGLSQQLADAGELRCHLAYYTGHHMELLLARALVRVLVWTRSQVQVAPSLILALVLARALDPALDPSLLPSLVTVLVQMHWLAGVQGLSWVRWFSPIQRLAQRGAQPPGSTSERVQGSQQQWSQKLELALEQEHKPDRVWGFDRKLKLGRTVAQRWNLEMELQKALERERKLELELELDSALELAQAMKLRLVQLVLEQSADVTSKLLFPAMLEVWQSTILQDMQGWPLSQHLEGLSEVGLVAHKWMEEEAEELARSTRLTAWKLSHHPYPPSISLPCKNIYTTKAKVSKMRKATHKELEQYMVKVLVNHARRVARWGLAPAADVQRDMLKGMERVWLFVSQHPLHVPEGR